MIKMINFHYKNLIIFKFKKNTEKIKYKESFRIFLRIIINSKLDIIKIKVI